MLFSSGKIQFRREMIGLRCSHGTGVNDLQAAALQDLRPSVLKCKHYGGTPNRNVPSGPTRSNVRLD